MLKKIKIFVRNLNHYNNGIGFGNWYTLPTSLNIIDTQLQLNGGDYAIHDYKAPFEISEYDDINTLNEIAKLLEELKLRDEVWESLGELCEQWYDSDNILGMLEEWEELDDIYYLGSRDNESIDVIIHNMYEEHDLLEGVPKYLVNYIDFGDIARDMDINREIMTTKKGHVFLNRGIY